MTAIPGDKQHAEADDAVESLKRALVSTLPPRERKQFDAFLRMLDDDQQCVTIRKSAACGKTEMLIERIRGGTA